MCHFIKSAIQKYPPSWCVGLLESNQKCQTFTFKCHRNANWRCTSSWWKRDTEKMTPITAPSFQTCEWKNSLPIRRSENESTNMLLELNSFLNIPLVNLKEDPLKLWSCVLDSSYPMLQHPRRGNFSNTGQTLYQQQNHLKGKLLLMLQSIDRKL